MKKKCDICKEKKAKYVRRSDNRSVCKDCLFENSRYEWLQKRRLTTKS